jgi:hypothetical protein
VRIYAKWCEPDSRWRHLKLPTSLPVPKAISLALIPILRADDVACVVAKRSGQTVYSFGSNWLTVYSLAATPPGFDVLNSQPRSPT